MRRATQVLRRFSENGGNQGFRPPVGATRNQVCGHDSKYGYEIKLLDRRVGDANLEPNF